MVAASRGWLETATPLIQASASGRYSMVATNDTPGLYVAVPAIADFLDVSPAAAVDIFLGGMVVLSVISAIAGIMYGWRTLAGRIIGVLGVLALAAAMLEIGDVYIATAAVPLAFAPWIIGADRRRATRIMYFIAPTAGLVAMLAGYVRPLAGIPLLAMLTLAVVLRSDMSWPSRSVVLSLAVLGAVIATLAFSSIVSQRDAYAVEHNIPPTRIESGPWHSAYIGLGYLPNDYGIEYRDQVAIDLVQARAPGTVQCSSAYYAILKAEVLDIIREDPAFFAKTILAKLGVAVGFLLAFANVGLPLLVWAKPPARKWIPLAVALLLASAYALVAIPSPNYLLGLIAFSTVLGLLGIDMAAEKWAAGPSGRTPVSAT